jgi:hemerythrin superfamily protein
MNRTQRAEEATMDGLEMLEEDHRKVEKLFNDFEEQGNQAYKAKQGIAEKVIDELTVHSEMEEKVLYPFAQEQIEDTEENVRESFEEHHVVEELMKEIGGMGPEDEQFDAKVTVLMENVRHHIEEEEGELFPKIRKALGTERLEELGERMQAVKVGLKG